MSKTTLLDWLELSPLKNRSLSVAAPGGAWLLAARGVYFGNGGDRQGVAMALWAIDRDGSRWLRQMNFVRAVSQQNRLST
jgi:hypothetical protein